MQAELVLRSDELRDALWALCDQKAEEAEAARALILSDTYIGDQTVVLGQCFAGLVQVEMDR